MTTGYQFEGDPRIIIDLEGAEMNGQAGQPEMDRGLENYVTLQLFTKKGWPGNALLQPNQQIGSDFEKVANQAVTITNLNAQANEAKAALADMVKDKISDPIKAIARNPRANQRDTVITISPPGGEEFDILTSKHGTNWLQQKLNPAGGS
jgi:phage gp46-like protein